MFKIEELIRGKGIGYSIGFDDILCMEGDKFFYKFKMPKLQKFNRSGDPRIY